MIPDSHKDILEAPSTAVLATHGHDGYPQLTALGFMWDADESVVKMTFTDARQKLKNLKNDPRCTVFVFDAANSYRTVEIRGDAELIEDTDLERSLAIAERYGSTRETMQGMSPPGETRYCVVVKPRKINVFGGPPAA